MDWMYLFCDIRYAILVSETRKGWGRSKTDPRKRKMTNTNDTKWMIRRDGRAFSCSDFVYCDTKDTEEALMAAQWLYRHTASEKTKNTVLRLFKTYGQLQSCYRDSVTSLLIDIASREDDFLDPVFIRSIAGKIRTAPMGKLSDLISAVDTALNEEFLRTACLEGAGDKDFQMRVSSFGFDWFPVIRHFLSHPNRREGVSSVSVVREERCAG